MKAGLWITSCDVNVKLNTGPVLIATLAGDAAIAQSTLSPTPGALHFPHVSFQPLTGDVAPAFRAVEVVGSRPQVTYGTAGVGCGLCRVLLLTTTRTIGV